MIATYLHIFLVLQEPLAVCCFFFLCVDFFFVTMARLLPLPFASPKKSPLNDDERRHSSPG